MAKKSPSSRPRGRALTARTLRLLACACVRQMGPAIRSSGAAIDLAERFADGRATAHELAAARFAGRFQPGHAAWAVCWAPTEDAEQMLERALSWAEGVEITGGVVGPMPALEVRERVLADLTGGPAGPIDPLWLAWNDGTVVKLAGAIYEDRAFDQAPILADALEDAGCGDAHLLDHLRGPGLHARGCWAVDLVLGLG